MYYSSSTDDYFCCHRLWHQNTEMLLFGLCVSVSIDNTTNKVWFSLFCCRLFGFLHIILEGGHNIIRKSIKATISHINDGGSSTTGSNNLHNICVMSIYWTSSNRFAVTVQLWQLVYMLSFRSTARILVEDTSSTNKNALVGRWEHRGRANCQGYTVQRSPCLLWSFSASLGPTTLLL